MLNHLIKGHLWKNLNCFLQRFINCQHEFAKFPFFASHLIPIIRAQIDSGVIRTRYLSTKNLGKYIDLMEDVTQRDLLIDQILQFDAKSYHQRICTIHFVESLVPFFSLNFFITHNFFEVLKMHQDPVINVVVVLCKSLPTIARKATYNQEEIWGDILECFYRLKKLNGTSFEKIYKCSLLEMEKLKNLNDEEVKQYMEWDEMLEQKEQEVQEKHHKVDP